MAEVFRFPQTPTTPPPKSILRTTLFTVIGPSGKALMCAAYDVETGLEIRLSYSHEDVQRTELFRGVDREEQLAKRADAWHLALIEKGFADLNTTRSPE